MQPVGHAVSGACSLEPSSTIQMVVLELSRSLRKCFALHFQQRQRSGAYASPVETPSPAHARHGAQRGFEFCGRGTFAYSFIFGAPRASSKGPAPRSRRPRAELPELTQAQSRAPGIASHSCAAIRNGCCGGNIHLANACCTSRAPRRRSLGTGCMHTAIPGGDVRLPPPRSREPLRSPRPRNKCICFLLRRRAVASSNSAAPSNRPRRCEVSELTRGSGPDPQINNKRTQLAWKPGPQAPARAAQHSGAGSASERVGQWLSQ